MIGVGPFKEIAAAALLALPIVVGVLSGAHAKDPPIVVREKDLACVIEHAETYLAADRNTLLIFLPDCAGGKLGSVDIAGGMSNTLPSPWAAEDISVSDYLPATKDEIRCLVEKPEQIVSPFGGTETQQPEPLVAVDFSACAE
jgi:hypothetical protein